MTIIFPEGVKKNNKQQATRYHCTLQYLDSNWKYWYHNTTINHYKYQHWCQYLDWYTHNKWSMVWLFPCSECMSEANKSASKSGEPAVCNDWEIICSNVGSWTLTFCRFVFNGLLEKRDVSEGAEEKHHLVIFIFNGCDLHVQPYWGPCGGWNSHSEVTVRSQTTTTTQNLDWRHSLDS